MTNFGAYYGTNSLNLSEENGVTIIWGSNTHGKTTIMNAFRYVLWGEIYGRNRRVLKPVGFVNTDCIIEHKDMLVELFMIHNDEEYIVSRGLKRLGGNGESEEDYEPIFQIKKGTQILSQKQAEDLLSMALPKSISRFYLFDGELLGEYEDLLDDADQSGKKIKESIETILGMPILLNGRDIMEAITREYNIEVAKASQNDETTKAQSATLAKLNEKLQNLRDSKLNLQEKLDNLLNQKAELTEQMQNSATFGKLIGERKAIEDRISELQVDLGNAIAELSKEADNAWRTVLNSILQTEIHNIKQELVPLEEKEKEHVFVSSVKEYIENELKLDGNHCPICSSSIDEESKAALLKKISEKSVSGLTEEEKSVLSSKKSQISFLKDIITADRTEAISRNSYTVETLQAKLRMEEVKLSQKTKEISKIGTTSEEVETTIMALPKKLEQCESQISIIEEGLSDNEENTNNTTNAINQINNALKKISSGSSLQTAIKESEFVTRLHSLFSEGISDFRNKLKEDVEKDATEIFKSISHLPDCDHLKINDNFGMRIIKTDGTVLPNRSSGIEQVVAISLISALHKNAPIEGPVFMDSTFQRIDEIHKINTLKTLPVLGNQIIVLAYHSEIGDKNDIRNELGSKLVQEYIIEQHSSSRSTLKEL